MIKNEADARAMVSPINKEGVLPNKKFGKDGARKSKTRNHCAREIAKNTVCLFPMMSNRGRHMTVEETDITRDVGTGHVGTIE
jgi:hypothetical protein